MGEQFIIEGGRPLRGEVRASGSKNSALRSLRDDLGRRALFAGRRRACDVDVLAKIMQTLGVP
jgi:UDP-N-acetylglucosamine enolpyruvyl transferase